MAEFIDPVKGESIFAPALDSYANFSEFTSAMLTKTFQNVVGDRGSCRREDGSIVSWDIDRQKKAADVVVTRRGTDGTMEVFEMHSIRIDGPAPAERR